jgi:hypothetical protein
MICYGCREKLTKTTADDYGNGINDQCEYNKRSCKDCCDCGGHS